MRESDKWRADLRALRKKVVFTNGCFDILHAGHVRLLKLARSFGDFLVVGVNTDDSIRRLKGPSRPINHQHDRKAVLEAIRYVDKVVFFSEDTPLEIITRLEPDVLVKGDDYEVDDIVGAREVIAKGGEVRRVPLLSGRSTTAIIEKLGNSQEED